MRCSLALPILPLEETVPAVHVRTAFLSVNSWFRLCTNLVPRAMITIMVSGLRMRLCVSMCTKLQNGILRNGQQPVAKCCEWLTLTGVNLK